jgi:hypothetical protein
LLWKIIERRKCQKKNSIQKCQNLLLVVAIGNEGIVTYNVIFGAFSTNRFLKSIIPSLDRQWLIVESV